MTISFWKFRHSPHFACMPFFLQIKFFTQSQSKIHFPSLYRQEFIVESRLSFNGLFQLPQTPFFSLILWFTHFSRFTELKIQTINLTFLRDQISLSQ